MRLTGIVTGGLAAAWCAAAAFGAAQPAARVAAKPKVAAAAKRAPNTQHPIPNTPVSTEAAEFFEKHVRPVLAEKCYSCHGPKLQQAGLRLDSRAALLKKMDTGHAAVVPGQPQSSALVKAVQHTGTVKMPPTGKLPEAEIEALATWVRMGAPWPGGPSGSASEDPHLRAKTHWAFQAVRKPAVPAVKNRTWVKTPVDTFILAKLEAKGLQPSPAADRRTLIRRTSYDLIGLPPTAEEIDRFVGDKSPDAYAKLIERLLASPHYGERWARYWLDVARYADTKGYVFQEERRYPFAYTYRDYVIQAFNEDLPYDRFLVDQIAADQLDLGSDKSRLAAMGFLTLGRRFLNNQADIIDDRLDTLFRGTQALTVACARCHDHKFDPIPAADYYSLYGVFASSQEPRDLPLIAEPERTEAYVAFEKQLNALQAEVDTFLSGKHGAIIARGKEKIAEGLLAAREVAGRDSVRELAAKYDIPFGMINRWQDFLLETRKNHHAIFTPWHALAAIPDAEFAAKAPALMAGFAGNADKARLLNPKIAQLFAEPAPASLKEVAAHVMAAHPSTGGIPAG